MKIFLANNKLPIISFLPFHPFHIHRKPFDTVNENWKMEITNWQKSNKVIHVQNLVNISILKKIFLDSKLLEISKIEQFKLRKNENSLKYRKLG